MKKWIFFTVLVFVLVAIVGLRDLDAQCPMCKISAESNLRDGGTAGKGLNTGILYMFVMPYILVGTLGYIWYRNRKQYDQESEIVE
ncbi:MAG: hypothetical protein WBO36_04875 [Saprospiraceae bacterium]